MEATKDALTDAKASVVGVVNDAADALPLASLRKSRASHSLVSFFLGTLMGNFVLLVIVAMTLVVSGTLVYMGITDCSLDALQRPLSCAEYPDDFWSAWWLSWGLHFDPGTQTGIDAQEYTSQKWMVVMFSILGFVLNLIFLGLFVEYIRTLLDTWRSRYGRIVANDHTVVLGWTDKTLFLLGELAEMMIDSEKGGGTIVVLGELEPLEMQMEVSIAFPEWRKRWRKVKVRYYQGKPYEVDDLLKVAVYAAERVIVLGGSRRPRVADSQMLTTICALRCLPDARFLTHNTNVIAELKQPQTEPVVMHIGGDTEPGSGGSQQAPSHPLVITPVVGNHSTNAIMSLAALDPSAGLALLDLMNFSGDQIETISCATFTARGKTTFGVLRNSFNSATPLGIKQKDKETGLDVICLAPSDDHEIDEHTFLLVIALDIASALASSKLAAKENKRQSAKRWTFTRQVVLGMGILKRHKSHAVAVDPNGTGSDEVDAPAALDLRAIVANKQSARCLIFVGWTRGFETLIRLLDARLPRGSEVHILSEQPAKSREFELLQGGLQLDGSAVVKEEQIKEGDYEEEPEPGLQNCTLYHLYGYTTDEKAIRRLPLSRADAAVVVADANSNENEDDALGGAELQIADSEALTSTILLRRLRIEFERSAAKPLPALTIVTEFVDLLTRRLLERQSDLINCAPKAPTERPRRVGIRARTTASPESPSKAAGGGGASLAEPSMPLSKNNGEVQSVVFHRNYIETTALSLAAHSNTSWVTVQMLLDPFSGYEIKSARIGDAVPNNVRAVGASAPPQSTTTVSDFRSSSPPTTRTERNSKEGPEPRLFSFADLSDILVAVGMGLLIGWRRGRGEVVINPDVKAEQLPWLPDDELIMLRRTGGGQNL